MNGTRSRGGTLRKRRVAVLLAAMGAALVLGTGTAFAVTIHCHVNEHGNGSCFGNRDEGYVGDGPDTIHGTPVRDSMRGFGGDDFLYGYAADDLGISGDEGDDELYGAEGDDSMWGNLGNDLVYGEADDDVANGGGGNDLVEGASGNDDLNGDSGAAIEETGQDEVYGGPGNDFVIGGPGRDTVSGGDGDDYMGWSGFLYDEMDPGHDGFEGGAGNDTIHAVDGNGDDELPAPLVGETVDCGPGRDTAYIDFDPKNPNSAASDRAYGCETVNRIGPDGKPVPPPPPPPPPNTRPTIYGLCPPPGAATKDRTPRICATVSDKEANVRRAGIRLYLDGKAKTFTLAASTGRLSHTSRPLAPGRHAVKIVATDTKGLTATKTWRFTVKR